ncbi:DNA polymerase phi-domain-containing protein [Crucibulum laeve]|uniref:DNA polymerase phi-domain-containing protein n=1 Tax=Crucibulum laeve TaxID=68775 RepID=A0A5C3MCC7_9AGAR|nr:DNA polymerase phi-domain-containing protein [Crucibulum laeve]
MSTTLPLFWHLSSGSKKERIDASVKLVGALEQFQAQFVPKPSSGTSGSDEDEDDENIPKSDGLDTLNAQDVSYSIRRLVRGLASPRESSRLGFAVALTELLSRIETVTCSQIVNVVMDNTKSQGSMTGQEERDILFARLFGLMSVIQSGLLVRTGSLPTSASSTTVASTLSSYETVISQLITLGDKKSWLRESAWFTISLALHKLQESEVSWKNDAATKTLHILFKEHDAWSPEKVALAAKLQDLYPDREWREYVAPPFKTPNLLASANLQIIARILKESTTEEDSKDVPKAPSGSWKPQLHFVWDVLLDQLLPGPNASRTSKGSFQEFFRIVVDESLFSSTASPQRKYWGFQVFQKALKRVTKDSMPMLFTKNFMRSWINHLSHRDRYLHKIAQQTVTEVETFVKSNPQLGFALILQLTGVNGSQQFDKLTKTKTVENILTSLHADGIKNYIEYLFSQVDEPENTEKSDIQAMNGRRVWIIDQLGALIRNSRIPKTDEWIQSILDWLVIHGLFIVKKKSTKSPFIALYSTRRPAFSDDIQQSCRNRLLSCISDLNSQTTTVKSGNKTTKTAAVASDGQFWVSRVLSTIQELEKDSKHISPLAEIDDSDKVLLSKAREVASRLQKVSSDRQEAAKGAELLLLATTLQQYCATNEDDLDLETLEVCIDGASRLFPEGKGKKGRKSTAIDSLETIHEPVDVLVDTIIGFLEKSTAYMRTVGNQVFSLLSGEVKDSTIDLIVTQLERRDPSELAANDQDESMEEAGDEEEEEDGSSGVDVASDEDDSVDEDSDNEEEEDTELRRKIEEALRVNGIEPATEDTDEEEDEELMDDDQMMAIDEQLAQVFRSQTMDKKSGKNVDAQREATHFKNRVLDLVDTFIKRQPTSPLIIRLLPPLLELISGTGQDERQLADKAKGIIRSRIAKAKEFPTSAEAQQVTDVLKNIHVQARKSNTTDFLTILSICSVYLSKLHVGTEASVVEEYRQSLADFITRKNSGLNAGFFSDFLRRFPILAWSLRDDLIGLTNKAVNAYRMCQVFHLLETLVNQIPALSESHLPEVSEFMKSLQKTLHDVIKDACAEKVTLTAAQLKDLIKLGLVAVRQTQRSSTAPQTVLEIWKAKSWRTLCDTLSSSSRFATSTALHKMCEQLAHIVEGENQSKKPEKVQSTSSSSKRKAGEVIGADEPLTEGKKNKRKKIKGNKS